MSDFSVPGVRIGRIEKHPNADTLSITEVEGCPVIIRTEDFKEGDRAIYVPVEAVVPTTVKGTEFLEHHRRIKAKKLRGIFSMGLLLPIDCLPWGSVWEEGKDFAQALNIVKYEEPERGGGGPNKVKNRAGQAKDPKIGPVYDVESYRKYGRKVFAYCDPGCPSNEQIIVTEKIHGTNFRFGAKRMPGWFNRFLRKLGFERTSFHVGSHRTWQRPPRGKERPSIYWKVAQEMALESIAKRFPGFTFYAEIYGSGVQDLEYGYVDGDVDIAIFDVYNQTEKRFVDYEGIELLARLTGLNTVPVLYHGPFEPEKIEPLRNGKSAICPEQMREGIVIRARVERPERGCGRAVLKLVGEDYLLRKGGTEYH